MNAIPWWVYALLSALFAALTTIFAKLGMQDISSTLGTAVRTVVVLVLAWLIVFGKQEAGQMAAFTTRTWLMLILSGVATGLSWLAYFRALQIGPTAWVAGVDKSSIVLIALLSALFLKEPLSAKTLLGVGLITVGTVVLIR